MFIELNAVFDFEPSFSSSASSCLACPAHTVRTYSTGADLWQAERQADKMAEYDGYDGFSCAPW